jgi:pimeloyl-ACP methyl ester carboxylesterase
MNPKSTSKGTTPAGAQGGGEKEAEAQESTTEPWVHTEGVVNGIRLHWVEACSVEDRLAAPLVVLLHGFPEFWYSWRHQITGLAQAGYRVVAPDLRGYNLSEKPVTGYDLDTLSEDVAQLITTLTTDMAIKKAYLVGHDWGGVVAWAVTARFPYLIRKLAILNGPHLSTFDTMSFRQRLKFWCIKFFQIPFLPELILGSSRARALMRPFQSLASEEDKKDPIFIHILEQFRDATLQDKGLKRMLQYYRSLFISRRQTRTCPAVIVPVLILWGLKDTVLGRELIEEVALVAYVEASVERVFLDCGHWTQQELPNQVNHKLTLFFS